jgi:hypothetical protein
MPVTTVIFEGDIQPVTPTYTDWFLNASFLALQTPDTGEYIAAGEFTKIAVVLHAQISVSPLDSIERIINSFQGQIDNIDLILIPQRFRNDCIPLRLQLNPSTGFRARLLAISC